jgi:hypothetical protein
MKLKIAFSLISFSTTFVAFGQNSEYLPGVTENPAIQKHPEEVNTKKMAGTTSIPSTPLVVSDPGGACRDSSRCGYCNRAGSCRACSGGGSGRNQKSSNRSSQNKNSRSPDSGSTRSNYQAPTYYNPPDAPPPRRLYLPAPAHVLATTLNVRGGPGTEFEILARLTEGDYVTITETAGESWVKITVSVWDGSEFRRQEGYVFKKHLSF